MPSQLYRNEAISFLACKPFKYRDTEYSIGDEFPQEEANNIESMVRARFVIPVVEDRKDKPRHWHREVRTREEAEEFLNRTRVQLRMPSEPDSDEVVNIPLLTNPQLETDTRPDSNVSKRPIEPENGKEGPEESAEPAESVHKGQYDPGYHTVREVNDHLAAVHDDEERERILEAERSGRGRKGIVEA